MKRGQRPSAAGRDGAAVVARGPTPGLTSVRVGPMSLGLIASPVHPRMSAEHKPRHSRTMSAVVASPTRDRS